MEWTKWKRGGSGRKQGKAVWLIIICAGLLAGSNTARLTGKLVLQGMVRSMVNPVCGLAAYAGADGQETFWKTVLKQIMAVPLPLISYAEDREAQETAVTDPVYEKYLSSEVLYTGGGGPLLKDELNSAGEQSRETSGDAAPASGETAGEEDAWTNAGQDENSPGVENDSAAAAGHLPAAASGRLYTLEQLENFDYLVRQLYFVHSSTTVYPSQLDAEALLSRNMTIEKQTGNPQILIHHTHGTEAFADSEEGQGKTILEVGDYLTELLEGYGYEVIHDRSIYPYDTAYSEACARVREILAENPGIQVVIDLHRDSTGSMKRFVTELDGAPTAQLMFFNGMCQTADGPIDYLSNPYLEDNLAFSLQMKLVAEAYYPGLTRPNFLKAYQYNQHLMPRYTLIEAGSDTNTFDEVCRAMVPLAKILDAVLSDPDAVPLAGIR